MTSSIKKRRVSSTTSSAATTSTDRKRRWGAGRQRVSSGSAPAINSDLIQVNLCVCDINVCTVHVYIYIYLYICVCVWGRLFLCDVCLSITCMCDCVHV